MRGRTFVVGALGLALLIAAGVALTTAPVDEDAPPRGELTDAERAAIQRLATVTAASMPSVPETVTVLTEPGGSAPLCFKPQCNTDELEASPRIPTGTTLRVEEMTLRAGGQIQPHGGIRYFKVRYGGHEGWISEFFTEGAPVFENGKFVRE